LSSEAIQFKNGNGDKVFPCPYYPIGSIYISVNDINPSEYFGGTWEQITDDAYLKIVSSNAGSLGGTSSDHKIPISSMPSHSHWYTEYNGNLTTTDQVAGNGVVSTRNPHTESTSDTGGGQAYYPYYLGIYVWKRTA
jgi:hypothetical protein